MSTTVHKLADDLLHISPADQLSSAGLYGLVAAINCIALFFWQGCKLPPVFEIVEIIGGHRFSRLDFNRSELFAIYQHTINLFPMIILPEVRLIVFAAMNIALGKLGDNQVLKDVSASFEKGKGASIPGTSTTGASGRRAFSFSRFPA